ncbi:MAG: twin-arginine translocation signal domain-containing protein, partial [Rhizobacter sp.]|nr:twin-arginine translocation signal domain-containing protein [Rhizobacter sp.]
MSLASRRSFLTASALAVLAVALPALAQAQSASTRNRVVFQVTDNDPARWNLVLNNVNGMREGVGAEGV